MPDGPPAKPAAPDSTASSWDIDQGRLVVRDGAVLPQIDFSGGNGSSLQPLEIGIQVPTGWLIAAGVSFWLVVAAVHFRNDGFRVTYGFLGAVIGSMLICLGLNFRFGRRARITIYVTENFQRRRLRGIWITRIFWMLAASGFLWVTTHPISKELSDWLPLLLFMVAGISASCHPTCVKESRGWFQLVGVPREVLLQLAAKTPPRDWNDHRPLGQKDSPQQTLPDETEDHRS